MDFDFSVIVDELPRYYEGLITTLKLLSVSLLLGFIMALCLVLLYRRGWGKRIIQFYSFFFRGTPLLVQIYLIYFGLPQIPGVKEIEFVWSLLKEPYFCAIIAFTLNTAAYTYVILNETIDHLPYGQILAAKAFGLSSRQRFFKIIMPQVLRRSFPAYSNEIIFMLHGTSLASVITLVDLTGAARLVYSIHYNPFEAFITVALFYWILTFILNTLFKVVEKRLHYVY